MKKKILIIVTNFLIILIIVVLYALYRFNYIPHKKYINEDFNIKTYISKTDKDNDGIDDQTDILNNVRDYIKTNPKYKSKYYATGYPNDEYGVCTDVVAFGLKGAGYDLMNLVNEHIKTNRNLYDIDVIDKNIDFRKVNSLAFVINGGVVEFISIVTFITVGYLLYNSNITIGMATIAFTYSTKFMEPIFELNLNIGRVKSVKKIKEKLISILKTENKSYKTIKKLEKIYFNNLKITLNDNTLVYDELKLDFPKKYLITGENGSGKSVLAKLIMGFLVANEGKILYNDFNSINISEHINYVPQVPVIFEGSYMDNITIYGTYSDKNLELYESCFPPQVIKNIKSNENLENLSSGEKQIIAIIRAFCSEKEFIILDEALSVMNQITIEKFMETIFDLNKSIVIIAHNVDEYKDRFYKTYKVIRKEI